MTMASALARVATVASGTITDSEFKSMIIESAPRLRAFALSLSGRPDRADDLVQETLLKSWANRSSFTPGTNLRAWLYTILRNEFYSQHRKRRREVEDGDGAYAATLSVLPGQDVALQLKDMQKALMELPVDQREALLLVSAADLSYEDAAAIAAVAVGTIKSRVSRARTKLAEILQIDGVSDIGSGSEQLAALPKRAAKSK